MRPGTLLLARRVRAVRRGDEQLLLPGSAPHSIGANPARAPLDTVAVLIEELYKNGMALDDEMCRQFDPDFNGPRAEHRSAGSFSIVISQ